MSSLKKNKKREMDYSALLKPVGHGWPDKKNIPFSMCDNVVNNKPKCEVQCNHCITTSYIMNHPDRVVTETEDGIVISAPKPNKSFVAYDAKNDEFDQEVRGWAPK